MTRRNEFIMCSVPHVDAKPAILVERSPRIATITLHHPAKLNSITKSMWRDLGEALVKLSAEDELRCIIVRGAGDRAFSAGADIGEFAAERSNVQQAMAYGTAMHQTMVAFRDCRHPVVAVIQGVCTGGGLEIAALCDLRVCGVSSRFGVPISKLGLVMGHFEIAALVELVGAATAREMLLEGRVFLAEEALRKGLVTRVVADDAVLAEGQATAERIAAGAPLVARWHKKFIRRALEARPLAETEIAEGFECYGTEDFRSGYRAFLKKESPQFQGK